MNKNDFLLPSELLTRSDINRISEMFTSPRKRRKFKSKSFMTIRAILCPVLNENCYNIWTSEIDIATIQRCESLMGHQAIAIPCHPGAILMKFRSCSLGRGITNDVPLDLYGNCNYLSPKHAVIFYDEFEHHYELLNYSCYGTYVDDIFISNNEKLRLEEKIFGPSSDELTLRRKLKVKPLRKARVPEQMFKCLCNSQEFEKVNAGWEGSVQVKNGSVLRFGCTAFIFVILDPLSNNE